MSYKAIDLFAGAGGFSLAAHNLGLDIVAAIELDAAASETYSQNIISRLGQKTHLLNEDILKINPEELREKLRIEVGELSLILGGPPCQGFSSHRIKDAGVDDPRNQLLLRYFDFVESFSPKAFLVENVAGLFWDRHKSYLDKFIDLANRHNYKIIFCGTLNAKDYGVPQNRKRAFILGIREDVHHEKLIFPPKQTHFSPSSIHAKDRKPQWRTASSVFEPLTNQLIELYIKQYFLPRTKLSADEARNLLSNLESGQPVKDDDPCKVHMQPTEKMKRRFQRTRLNGSRTDAGKEFELDCHANGYAGHKDVYGRMFIHQPANTITTGCNNPSKGRFVHPWKNHGITLRHAARLQTFPDDFTFFGSTTNQAKQIGNAVPPELGKVLIETIMNGME
ncbi:DNA cytosine methyltransferase [Shewanella xiamenensis]|uniref:DNA cytosine methyltransferase n=1 Tax=Shewanella xiamenensis TaxID=332186 RepID=UPI00166E38E7|nr:DNA cytosine methyltransferase [Shewanella xiamenensis]MCL1071238.1 DNA cytosine methyltransferase [Shewanella xiamenensis]GGM78201.1 cytosine-specific methyltransferase [Shewanella xiamenensis]